MTAQWGSSFASCLLSDLVRAGWSWHSFWECCVEESSGLGVRHLCGAIVEVSREGVFLCRLTSQRSSPADAALDVAAKLVSLSRGEQP